MINSIKKAETIFPNIKFELSITDTNSIDGDIYTIKEILKPDLFKFFKTSYPDIKFDNLAYNSVKKKIKIKADEKQLRQVIGNVIKNSSENFEENNIKNKIITFSSIFTHKNILLSIQDNGIGIKKANKIRVLEPYFTTKKNGTGLGLAISKKIIEDHQGEINIESSDKGTKVNIKFPIKYN